MRRRFQFSLRALHLAVAAVLFQEWSDKPMPMQLSAT
jgi:hypothetical protein